MAGQTLLDLIERMTVSKELTPDKAEEIARTLPIIAINAPRIISELKSAVCLIPRMRPGRSLNC
jgi:hypothetical protein